MAESVHQLIGMAPFQGISVGVARKSPVSWSLYERHGVFHYTGTLRSVTYRAGAAGPDSPAAVAQALRDAAAEAVNRAAAPRTTRTGVFWSNSRVVLGLRWGEGAGEA
ncbi:hypothetical protein [Streptomyces endocoffeicus]|uniref:hypothetical protein n=1 Tax=Streptomyces endocoffeicus TaxID=2898945 RepID=UPI0035562782